ncbi:MAG TPA: Uma2 family endonuclease [Polyangium sp.]|nr:Uma2 family endonuclease [Polyangium sp.]
MGYAAERIPMTEEEYLAFERASDERHEFANGEVFAMSGGTYEHALIAGNIIRDLGLGLRGRRCTVQTSDMRIYIPTSGRYVYADASVVCGRPQFRDETRDNLLNPRVVVEVLSPSTEEYDRGEKFTHYQTLPSLAHYVLAAQDKPCIEVFTRMDDGSWKSRAYGPGDRVELPAIECAIDVDLVYTNVFDTDYDDEPARINM